jgi:penicillin G amidase
VQLSRFFFRSLGKRMPVIDGEIQHAGLNDAVEIRRDAFGVPHIEAGNDWDAWFALGFCQAQDRSFQLEGIVRSVRGTVSEMVGTSGLRIDRLSRRVGFKRAAHEHMKHLDDDIRLMTDAFAAGVNAARDVGQTRNAHEFTLLRARPTAWESSDVLGYLKLMSMAMSTNWAEELARYQILIRDGIDALEALEPGISTSMPVANPPGDMAKDTATELMREARQVIEALGLDTGGSNNWVVSGGRTRSGKPILANDTHLRPVLPTHFYLAHLKTPEWGVAGGSFTGSPGFFLGHNGYAAWGITIGFLDNTDLFIEEIGRDEMSVREGDRFVPCEVREEKIMVKGADDLTERVLITGRGPVVGPALDGHPISLSLSAVWLQNSPYRSMFNAHRWRSFEHFADDLNAHPNVSLNVVYADESGDIGWKLAGQMPVRTGSGAMPLPAADVANHWSSPNREPDDRLWAKNPDAGFIATANSRPCTDATEAGFGVDWLEAYRLARIQEYLRERDDWTSEDFWQLQMDTVSLPWRSFKPIISAIDSVDDDSRAAKQMLLRWDGNVGAQSSSAALFETFIASLMRKVVERAAPVSWTWAMGQGGVTGFAANYFGVVRTGQIIKLAQEKPRGWFDEGWNSVLANSLGDGLRMLRLHFGYHTKNWHWGKVRPMILRNQSGRGPLATVFNRGPYAVGGDASTVHAAGVEPADPLNQVRSTATARTVIEIGDWDNTSFVLLGGQSGNPVSPNYDDQIPLWLEGKGVRVPWTERAVREITTNTLTLLPD